MNEEEIELTVKAHGGYARKLKFIKSYWDKGFLAVESFGDVKIITPVVESSEYEDIKGLDRFIDSSGKTFVAMRGSKQGIRSRNTDFSVFGGRKYEYEYYYAEWIGERLGFFLANNSLHAYYYEMPEKKNLPESWSNSSARKCFWSTFSNGIRDGVAKAEGVRSFFNHGLRVRIKEGVCTSTKRRYFTFFIHHEHDCPEKLSAARKLLDSLVDSDFERSPGVW